MTTPPSHSQENSLETLSNVIHQNLQNHLELGDHDDKRFFPTETAKTVLDRSRLQDVYHALDSTCEPDGQRLAADNFAERVEKRELQTYLAIIIYSRCGASALHSFAKTLLASTWSIAGSQGQDLGALPTDRQMAGEVLGDNVAADLFVNNQGLFCAAIIRAREELICPESRRLPFLEEELKGGGSFGTVYKVLVAKNHFQDGPTSNTKDIWIARKDYVLEADEKTHEKEREVMREIVRNVKNHRNIIENYGGLQIGSKYSLFMPLADCDLWQYMTEKVPDPPSNWEEKAAIVHCMAELADAVVFLHNELKTEKFEKISCFHLDLKPQNVLVVIDEEQGKQWWKLSDFNMSKVKASRREKRDDVEQTQLRSAITFGEKDYDFNKLFRKRTIARAEDNTTEPTAHGHRAGTYLAPEASIQALGSIQAKSDIWSLGCIISVVYTYLYGGKQAIKEFGDQRCNEKQPIDRFFSIKAGNNIPKISDVSLNTAVVKWFQELRKRTAEKNKEEGVFFKDMTKFIQDDILVVNSEQRKTTAGDIRDQLITAFQAFDGMMTETESPLRSSRRRRFGLGIFKSRVDEVMEPLQGCTISSPEEIKGCEFGPNAQSLVCFSEKTLAAYSLEKVCQTSNFDDLISHGTASLSPEGISWSGNVAVSSQFVAASTNHSTFDCHIYEIPGPSSQLSGMDLIAELKLQLPAIWKIAISADGENIAFVIRSRDELKPNGFLYIVRLEHLIATHGRTPGSESKTDLDAMATKRSSILSSSTSASSTATAVPLDHGNELISLSGPAEHIRDLRFGANALFAIMKPESTSEAAQQSVTTLAWSFQEGKAAPLKSRVICHDGQADLIQGLFTSFTPHDRQLACTVIIQENRILSQSWELDESIQSKAPGYRLLQVLPDPSDDAHYYCFGTKEAHNELWLLRVDAPQEDVLTIKQITKVPSMTYQSKFMASMFRPTQLDAKEKPRIFVIDLHGAKGHIHQIILP